jgi:hypothetical protein
MKNGWLGNPIINCFYKFRYIFNAFGEIFPVPDFLFHMLLKRILNFCIIDFQVDWHG